MYYLLNKDQIIAKTAFEGGLHGRNLRFWTKMLCAQNRSQSGSDKHIHFDLGLCACPDETKYVVDISGEINYNRAQKRRTSVNKPNYQRMLEETLTKIKASTDTGGSAPTLLLHSCCAPCSSYVLEYLSEYFQITVFYYNPNIYPDEEYLIRVKEQQEFIRRFPAKHPISFIEGDFDKDQFYRCVRGLEKEPEGGRRCEACFRLRLERTAKLAKELGMDYFTTTLTISPLKNATLLNDIGGELSEIYGVPWLYSDFKKRGGYQRSVELSREYNMYRQDYCGCVFSKEERERQKNKDDGTVG